MSLKKVVATQYKKIVDNAKEGPLSSKLPAEGWICTVRKALGMSRVQLAKKLGISRAQVFKFEKEELNAGVTIRTMQRIAEAMGCSLVYAIVPPETVDDLIIKQAEHKAKYIVDKVNIQMALEEQLLPAEKRQFEINRLTREIIDEMPAHLWDEENKND